MFDDLMILGCKKNYRLLIGCLLLFAFLVKFTSPVNHFNKLHKQSGLLTSSAEEQDDSDKKEESKIGFNYNEWADFFATNQLPYFTCQISGSTYPEYQIDFITTHFPAVITPPPNC